MSGIKSVFGGGGISHAPFGSSQALEPLFALLESEGVKTIDTAQIYGDSEKLLGGAKAGTRFTLDTKHAGGAKPGNTRADLVKWAKESIERLQVDKVCKQLSSAFSHTSHPSKTHGIRSTAFTSTLPTQQQPSPKLSQGSTRYTSSVSLSASACPTSPPRVSRKSTPTAKSTVTSSPPCTKVTTPPWRGATKHSSSRLCASSTLHSTPTHHWPVGF